MLIFTLRSAATAVVVAVLVSFVDWRQLGDRSSAADLRYLVAIVLLRPLLHLVRGWRFWHLVQAASQAAPPFWRTLGWHFLSVHLGTFTPAGVGEVSLAFYMRREGVAAESTLAAMVLDKITTLSMLAAMGAIGAVVYLDLDVLWLAGLGALLATLLALSFLLRRWIEAWREATAGRVRSLADTSSKVLTFAASHPGVLALNVAAAGVQSLLFSAQLWLGFRALSASVDYWGIFWLSAVGRLVHSLPITLGGLGVYEGSMMLLFERLGADREIALAAVLLPRTLTWLLSGLTIASVVWWQPWRRTR